MPHSHTLSPSDHLHDDADAEEPSVAFYGVAYVAIAAGIAVALWALDALVGVQMPGAATSIVAPIVAALLAGQRWAARHGSVPSSSAAWRFALRAAGAVLLVNLGVWLVIATAYGAAVPATGTTVVALTGSVAIFGAALVGVNRLFVTYGASSQLRGAR
ncbi:ABZJ_00895 family protein [Jannaschia sp. W003]|uniref:ABZJ_00895 family protein n=1 Tax=Jannaschia sp. W003 TaxID=2867012 RepID=UPI0021A89B15|nr:ABZJ_00895 family protein [Jannaschia sp. W003]UWQ20433.1 ABZJ_00895 family protein [Jannaschia sp. W003]